MIFAVESTNAPNATLDLAWWRVSVLLVRSMTVVLVTEMCRFALPASPTTHSRMGFVSSVELTTAKLVVRLESAKSAAT